MVFIFELCLTLIFVCLTILLVGFTSIAVLNWIAEVIDFIKSK